jgi:hypothetical protein
LPETCRLAGSGISASWQREDSLAGGNAPHLAASGFTRAEVLLLLQMMAVPFAANLTSSKSCHNGT